MTTIEQDAALWDAILDRVYGYFKGDINKTMDWIYMPNPSLGNLSPARMIYLGRGEKLLQWIDCQIEGNLP